MQHRVKEVLLPRQAGWVEHGGQVGIFHIVHRLDAERLQCFVQRGAVLHLKLRHRGIHVPVGEFRVVQEVLHIQRIVRLDQVHAEIRVAERLKVIARFVIHRIVPVGHFERLDARRGIVAEAVRLVHHVDRTGRAVRVCEVRLIRAAFRKFIFPRGLEVHRIDQRGDKFTVVLGQDGGNFALCLFVYPFVDPLDRIRVRDLLNRGAEIFVHLAHIVRQEFALTVKPALVEPQRVRGVERHDARIAVIGLKQILDALIKRIQIVDAQGVQQFLLRLALCTVCQHSKAQADGIGRHRPVALRVQHTDKRIRKRPWLLRRNIGARSQGIRVCDPSHGFIARNRIVGPELQRTGRCAVRIGDVVLVRHVDHTIHPALAHTVLRPFRNVVTRGRACAASRGQFGILVVQIAAKESRCFLPGDGVV